MRITQKLASVAMAASIIFGCGATLNAATSSYNINETFPDTALRSFVRQFDTNSNGYLDSAEIANAPDPQYAMITLTDSSIGSLEGMEIFTSCERLFIKNSYIKTLDMTPLPMTHVILENCPGVINAVGGKNQNLISFDNCAKLKNTYFNYAYDLRYVDFLDCPSLAGNIYLDNCDLLTVFIAHDSNIKTVTFSDKASLIGFESVNCPLRSIYMPATGAEKLTMLSIETYGRSAPGITCKGDLARILWELERNSSTPYNIRVKIENKTTGHTLGIFIDTRAKV